MTAEEIIILRKTHCPQPTKGAVLRGGLYVAKDGNAFLIWDDKQTAGYLCAVPTIDLLGELLTLESQSPGFIRSLITGEASPFLETPPAPWQDTYRGPARINLDDILEKRNGRTILSEEIK